MIEDRKGIYSILLVLLPIINQYQIFTLSYLDLFNLFVLITYMIKNKGKIRVDAFIPYIIYALLFMCISMFGLNVYSPILMIKNIAAFILLVFNLFFVSKHEFSVEVGYYYYYKIVQIISYICIAQYAIYRMTAAKVFLVIPFLTLNYGDSMTGSELINILSNTTYRPSAFFLEPAYLAEYALPLLFISLFIYEGGTDNKTIIKNLLITLGICLSTSMTGIVGAAIVWSLFVIKLSWSNKNWKLIILVPVIVAVVVYIFSLESIQDQIASKMYSIQNLNMSTSLSYRLTRGWLCFRELDILHKIIGTGYNCIGPFFSQHGIFTILDTDRIVSTYMNGLSLMLCSLGIVGTILYLIPFLRIGLKNRNTRILLLCWLMLMLSSQYFDTAMYMLMVSFMFVLAEMDDNFMISVKSYRK